jgi:hypothetical protein
MIDVEHITRANVIFIVPVHPGDAPVHAANATGLAITKPSVSSMFPSTNIGYTKKSQPN